ncbi:hypothetical protein [Bradyrhizobium sp. STM 3843]|uniref:hypothetical protein n=1 Tax=Bradyrhizobium sp. STM 3843 TaxID=551947 RepID=UPI000561F597|nr:hypothetical protein [Bradyrhizobium sp. STM 3843]
MAYAGLYFFAAAAGLSSDFGACAGTSAFGVCALQLVLQFDQQRRGRLIGRFHDVLADHLQIGAAHVDLDIIGRRLREGSAREASVSVAATASFNAMWSTKGRFLTNAQVTQTAPISAFAERRSHP